MPATTTPVPPSVLREARRIVEAEPAIEAIVLFGSRARGEHHRNSDVDLAIVSAAPHREVRDACRPLTEASQAVQIVPVDPTALRRYRNTANRVERAIVVDGKPLAGIWHRPRHRREATDMDHKAFANGLESCASHADGAIRDIARAKARGDEGTNQGASNAFRAGEHAAKAVLALYGLTPRKTHGVVQLATADYASELVEPTETTEQRLTRAVRLAERCIDLYARQATGPSREPVTPPDAQARALEQIADSFHGSPESLHKAPSRVRLSPDTNAAIESVCTTAAVATEACANAPTRLRCPNRPLERKPQPSEFTGRNRKER